MESITSKRHFLNFYGMLFLSFFLGGLGILLLFIHNPDKKIIAIIGGLLLIFISIYLCISYIKNTPKITITNKDISFNNKSFKIEDIQRITLKGKNSFSFSYEKESVTIFFKNGEIKHIFDDMYRNTSQMKLALDYLINNCKHSVVKKVKINLASEHFYKYKGVFIYNFRALMYFSILVLFISILFLGKKANTEAYYIISVFLLFFTLLFQWQFNYFELNKNYLRVRNQMKFWKNDIYRIEDIEEVTFESQNNAPHCLKIIFKDYATKKYTAATLNNRKWKELQRALEKLNIRVINKL